MDDNNSNNEIKDDSIINNDDNSEAANNDTDSNEQSTNDNNKIGNGYKGLASNNREAFTRGLNDNYADRIARNKANLAQARARSNETQKKGEDGKQVDKISLDRAKDKANVLKNKTALMGSKIDNARSKAFQMMHPIEAQKIIAKKAIKKWLIGILLSSLPMLLCIFVVFIACFFVLGLFDSNDSSSGGYGSSIGVKESGFTISATSLSREEYASILEEYATKKNSNFEIFAENANGIYDYAISKNINPELVVVRAYVEGNGTTTGTYNYWGMGCDNEGGLSACFNYSDFEEGYTDYINNISQYNSLADMMSKYAYIGKYWYNPGGSGIGGCYYAEYIYDDDSMPERVKKACSNTAPTCSVDDKTNCIETTEDDQIAYATWQVEINMADARYTIFGLKFDEGPTSYNKGDFQHLSNYTLNHNGLNVLNRKLTQTEVNELNYYINSQVDSAGYGTGDAVAAAGQALTYWLEQKGYYLQYRWGGGHYNKADEMGTFIGVNLNWGSTEYGCDSKKRCYYGMDCSGFVSWAIRTACNPNYGTRLANFSSGGMAHGPEISIDNVKPGDLMLTKGHVRLVIKNNNDGSIIVAEEAGGNTSGLVFSKKTADSSYSFVDMGGYYKKTCKLSR